MDAKTPMQSRKFRAYLIAEFSWKILAGLVLFWGRESMQGNVFIVLLAIVVIAGFVEAMYIGGQGSIDKYIGLAKIAADTGQSFSMKGVSMGGNPQPSLKDEPPAEGESKKKPRG